MFQTVRRTPIPCESPHTTDVSPFFPQKLRVKEMLGIPGSVHPMVVVAIAHPVQQPESADRYAPEKVKLNQELGKY